MDEALRNLPSVDRLLKHQRIEGLGQAYAHDVVVDLVRQHLDLARTSIAGGSAGPSPDELAESICLHAQALFRAGPQRVINAAGVILHTNLGRAPLSTQAAAAMGQAAQGYCNLEIDLHSGRRGSRQVHVEHLLCQVSGAQAALAVNNNASAVLLALSALARRKEVLVSRGQEVEIGGGFRVPEVMQQSGARLVEVGTTNRTYAADYERAIGPRTAAILNVHYSNFKMVGFTESPAIWELVALGERYGLPILDDLGSGCLIDTARFGLDAEPMVQQSVAAGCALSMFSGDKLIGGPQAGLIVGKREMVERLRRHPLARAVRIDKIRLAGLSTTLLHYLKGEAETQIPVWRMIAMGREQVEQRARTWAQAIGEAASVVSGESMVGGGSLPGNTLPTALVSVRGRGQAQRLARRLRSQDPPLVGRIERDTLLLDPRTVLPEEDEEVLRALKRAIAADSSDP